MTKVLVDIAEEKLEDLYAVLPIMKASARIMYNHDNLFDDIVEEKIANLEISWMSWEYFKNELEFE